MIKINYTKEPQGSSPIQAEGFIKSLPFYFRCRGPHRLLSIAKTPDGNPLDHPNCFYHGKFYSRCEWEFTEDTADAFIRQIAEVLLSQDLPCYFPGEGDMLKHPHLRESSEARAELAMLAAK